jgi:hypothetical protein
MPIGIKTIYETKLYKTLKPTRNQFRLDILWQRIKFLRQNLSRAANRGAYSKEISVDLDYLYKIGEKQNWLCALTGIPLEFTRGGTYWGGKWCNPNSCTIDRINNNKGYVKGNVQLVTWKANCMRNHWPLKEFINLCKQIAKFKI